MPDYQRNLKTFTTDPVPRQIGGSYRWFTGSLAYVLHRVSGLGLTVYLFLHITSVSKATNDERMYDILIRRFQEPDFKVGEIALYAALLYHAINGIRILLVDFVFERSHKAKPLFWAFTALTGALLIVGAIPLILHLNVQPIYSDALPGVAAP